ncbi:glycosyl hydrolase family 18 protein, partial [Zooshikella ganghwensis]|uniref:glycosyl hydrolase family 18 protein n=1 Tax=Zooshikella ganghwensis TaxID=202772 RepID=UPI000686B10C
LPSIGGWTLSDPFYYLAKDTQKRATFVKSAIEFLKQYPFFDGLDIDWEFPGVPGANPKLGSPEDKAAFTALMRDLRQALDALSQETGKKYQLTAATSAGPKKIDNINYAEVSGYVDYIFAMTYDFYGAWDSTLGHHSGLYAAPHEKVPEFNAHDAVQNLTQAGLPGNKLVLGAAMYGRGWTGIKGGQDNNPWEGTNGKPIKGSWQPGVIDYKHIVSKYLGGTNGQGTSGFKYFYDDTAQAPYLWNASKGELITYDNPRSVKAKAQYVTANSLAGVFSWEIDADNGDILKAIHEGLGNKPGDNPKPPEPPTPPDDGDKPKPPTPPGDGDDDIPPPPPPPGDPGDGDIPPPPPPGDDTPGDDGDKPVPPANSWQADQVYTKGDRVTYQSKTYEAKWWTRGDEPGKDQWGPWERLNDTPDDPDDGDDGKEPPIPPGDGDDDGDNPNPPTPGDGSQYKVIGYYMLGPDEINKYPSVDFPISNISPEKARMLTHINFAFIGINQQGQCDLLEGTDQNKASEVFKQLNTLKQYNPKLKLMFSVGGWAFSNDASPTANRFRDAAASDSARKTMASSCIKLMKQHQFDGIDLDWEYPRKSDANNFVSLLKEFRQQINAQEQKDSADYHLTIAGAGGAFFLSRYYAILDQVVAPLDFLNLMTYDFNGPWQGVTKTNFHAHLYGSKDEPKYYNTLREVQFNPPKTWEEIKKLFPSPFALTADAAVKQHLIMNIPREKIVMGVPFYGRAFKEVGKANNGLYQSFNTPGGDPYQGDPTWLVGCDKCVERKEPRIATYADIKKMLAGDYGYERFYHPEAKAPWLYNAKHDLFVTYDDAESLTVKTQYIKQEKLGGVMFWHLGQDDQQGTLLRSLHNGLNAGTSPGDGDTPKPPQPPTPPDGDKPGDGDIPTPPKPPGDDGDNPKPPTPPGDGDKPQPPKPPLPPGDGDKPGDGKPLAGNVFVGYWENWNSNKYVPMSQVNEKYNVLIVAFPSINSDGSVVLGDKPTPADIKAAQAKGKKVLLSIGGQNALLHLDNQQQEDNFVNSLISIFDRYGFNGIDIDTEHGLLASGSPDKPTGSVLRMINALKRLKKHYGASFLMTFAPETANVVGGLSAWGNAFGNYLPIFNALKNDISWVHMQYYNSGSMLGLDKKPYRQGTQDFLVALTEAVIKGFEIGGTGVDYTGLKPSQVVIGLPSTQSAAPAGGYTAPATVKAAIRCLRTGQSCGSYKPQQTYPGFRGLMTWDVNWDSTNNYNFVNTLHSCAVNNQCQ